MHDPLDYENRSLYESLLRKKRSAYRSLLVEHITHHTWRPIFWCVLFAGLWMLEAPQFFGLGGALFCAILFFAGLAYFIKIDLSTFTLPDVKQIDKRLEESSHLRLGQLLTLEDTLANPAKRNTRDLWDAARKKTLSLLPSLKSPHPRALLARKDPYGLRLFALLVFICGLLISGPDWSGRIRSGLIPVTPSYILSGGRSTIDLWIKPPDYTGLGQIHLNGSGRYRDVLNIPEGSTLKIRLTSLFGPYVPPVLLAGDNKIPLTYLENGLFGIEMPVPSGAGKLKIRQLLIPRAIWNYNYVIDQPPSIRLSDTEQPYEIFPDGPLRFPLIVHDDYGVNTLEMSMDLDELVIEKPIGDPYFESRLVMSSSHVEFEIQPTYNLTWHTWAGLPVVINFSAKDHKEQTAKLEPIKLVLPERIFKHPLAKSLIAMRKNLAWGDKNSFFEIAQDIEIFLTAPHLYQHKIIIFLALRTASSRLYYAEQSSFDDPVKTAKAVVSLLWDTALAVEDGDLTLAMRNLRDAQKALENALRNPDSTDREITRLMENLREQMAEYFQELQKELQKRMAEGSDVPNIPEDMLNQMMNTDEFASMLQQLESDLLSGDRNAAKEMLSQLQRMMDSLDPSLAGALPEDMQMIMEGVNELQELITRQEQLLEQTQEQSARKQNQNSVDTQKNKAEQEALRYVLGQLMLDAAEHLDEIPQGLGLAEQEMRGSEEALGANDPGKSIPHQEAALEHLKETQDQLSKQFEKRMQQIIAMGFGGMKYDPLGRPYATGDEKDGKNHGSKVKIPDEAEKKRIEDVLRILRERSGQLERPAEEREYLRRLLRQF